MIPKLAFTIVVQLIRVKIRIKKLLNALHLGMLLAEYYSIGIYNGLISIVEVKKKCVSVINKFVNQGRLT